METCMLLCFHVHITWKHTCFPVNVYMKAHYHACFHVLLQLVLTFDPHWKRVHYGHVMIQSCVSPSTLPVVRWVSVEWCGRIYVLWNALLTPVWILSYPTWMPITLCVCGGKDYEMGLCVLYACYCANTCSGNANLWLMTSHLRWPTHIPVYTVLLSISADPEY